MAVDKNAVIVKVHERITIDRDYVSMLCEAENGLPIGLRLTAGAAHELMAALARWSEGLQNPKAPH